jgi:hypothetical protein
MRRVELLKRGRGHNFHIQSLLKAGKLNVEMRCRNALIFERLEKLMECEKRMGQLNYDNCKWD